MAFSPRNIDSAGDLVVTGISLACRSRSGRTDAGINTGRSTILDFVPCGSFGYALGEFMELDDKRW